MKVRTDLDVARRLVTLTFPWRAKYVYRMDLDNRAIWQPGRSAAPRSEWPQPTDPDVLAHVEDCWREPIRPQIRFADARYQHNGATVIVRGLWLATREESGGGVRVRVHDFIGVSNLNPRDLPIGVIQVTDPREVEPSRTEERLLEQVLAGMGQA